jgi:hypothetical protein
MRGWEEPLHATISGTEASGVQKEVVKKWGGKDMKREMIKREEGERARTCLSQTIAPANFLMCRLKPAGESGRVHVIARWSLARMSCTTVHEKVK